MQSIQVLATSLDVLLKKIEFYRKQCSWKKFDMFMKIIVAPILNF